MSTGLAGAGIAGDPEASPRKRVELRAKNKQMVNPTDARALLGMITDLESQLREERATLKLIEDECRVQLHTEAVEAENTALREIIEQCANCDAKREVQGLATETSRRPQA